MPDSPTATCEDVIAGHDAWMTGNYPRWPVVMQRGLGAELWDDQGDRYIDLFAGFGAGLLGHCHPDVVAAVSDQAQQLWHVGNLMHTAPQVRLARAISEAGFGGKSFFCHSGADANEAALKLARLFGNAHPGPAGPRRGVIAATLSFHGRSFGTMPATGQPKVREGFEPLQESFTHVPFGDLDAVRSAVGDDTVAIMVEPIQGEGGVVVPPDDYLPGLRSLCDEHDLLLICDEVWTGVGRTGRYFAHQHWLDSDHAPDLMTLAKGVGAGLPVGVMCAHERVAGLFDFHEQGRVTHATTLGGNCLSMAAAAAVFEVIARDSLTERAAELGDYITQRLTGIIDRSMLQAVRGRGLFLGLQLAEGSDGADVVTRCRERRVLINATQGDVLRLAPPLTLERGVLDEGLDVLESVLCGE
jgi:predicted acetylornithine/succinylornithine family transaminase